MCLGEPVLRGQTILERQRDTSKLERGSNAQRRLHLRATEEEPASMEHDKEWPTANRILPGSIQEATSLVAVAAGNEYLSLRNSTRDRFQDLVGILATFRFPLDAFIGKTIQRRLWLGVMF